MSRRNRNRQSQTESELALVREQRALLELENERRGLEVQEAVARDIAVMESWTHDYVDPRDYRVGWGGEPIGYYAPLTERRNGRNSPFVESEGDLAMVRSMARLICEITPPGKAIQNSLTNYVVGKGWTYTATTKVKQELPRGLLPAVQDVLDQFIDQSDWKGDLDRELFWRGQRDGEYFLSVHGRRDGSTAVRVLEPDQITEPPNGSIDLDVEHAVNWTFGVCTADHDVQTVHGYAVEWEDSPAHDFLSSSHVVHSKRNVDRNVKRGMSSFFSGWRWLERQDRLLRGTSEGAAICSAIAYIRQHVAGVTSAQAQTLRSANADRTYNTTTAGGGTKTHYEQNRSAGTVLDVPKGQEYIQGPHSSDRGNAFLQISQAIARHVGSIWSMPEYLISGDASNNNMASSITATSPFIQSVEALRAQEGASHQRILWKVLEIAHRFGLFRQFNLTWQQLKRMVEIQIECPPVEDQKPLEQTQRREVLYRNGVLSKQSWQAQEGLDPEQEDENFDQEGGPPKPPEGPTGPTAAPESQSVHEAGDCGTGAGGFKPGNDCGGSSGGGAVANAASKLKAAKSPKQRREAAKEALGEYRAERQADYSGKLDQIADDSPLGQRIAKRKDRIANKMAANDARIARDEMAWELEDPEADIDDMVGRAFSPELTHGDLDEALGLDPDNPRHAAMRKQAQKVFGTVDEPPMTPWSDEQRAAFTKMMAKKSTESAAEVEECDDDPCDDCDTPNALKAAVSETKATETDPAIRRLLEDRYP